MRNYFLIVLAAAMAACTNSAPVVQNTSNTNSQPPPSERPSSVIAHTTENQPPAAANSGGPAAGPGRWSGGGEPIDTARFDGAIAAAEKIVSSKPGDEAAKKDLAQAYYDRGVALTEARQYAAALGDYRRALKADPTHEESKNWIDQIETIYKSLKKAPPREGQEPKPLPVKKD